MTISAQAPDSASEPLQHAGIATLDSLARTARQVALYGRDHPIALEALASACRDLEQATQGASLEIRARPDGLVWNGSPLAGRAGNIGRFHTAMRDRLIASITIAPSVRPEDLGRLLFVLAAEADELAGGGGASAVFGASPGSTVRLSEVDFGSDVLVSEAVWQKLSEGVGPGETAGLQDLIAACARGSPTSPVDHQTGSAPEASVADANPRHDESAEDVIAAGIARLVQRSGEALYFTDEDGWLQWRDDMAQRLAGIDPRWRSAVFRAPAGVSTEYPDMLSLVAASMSEADCVSLLLDHPDSIRAERSDMLALALERILADRSRRADIEAALHQAALQRGVSEAVYQNVVGLLVGRIEGKVGPEPQAAAVHSTLEPLGAVSAPDIEHDLSDLLSTTEPAAVRHSRLCLLREALDSYLSTAQYGTVISLLTRASEECAAAKDLPGLTGVIAALGAEAHGAEAARRAVALGALARAGTEQVVSALAGGLERAPQETTATIIELLGLLGEPGLQHLLRIVQSGSDLQARRAMARLLECDSADMSHLRDLISRARGLTLERALGALLDPENAMPADRIMLACTDASEEAELQVVNLVLEHQRTDLGQLLIACLSRPSGAVRLAAIEAISRLDLREAVSDLCDVVSRESAFGEGARLREAAVRALGALGEGGAVPVLCQILEGGAFLSKLGSRRARVAAAEALAALGGPDSREALQRGRRSLHPSVRDACRRALSSMRASGRSPVGAHRAD